MNHLDISLQSDLHLTNCGVKTDRIQVDSTSFVRQKAIDRKMYLNQAEIEVVSI